MVYEGLYCIMLNDNLQEESDFAELADMGMGYQDGS